MDSYLQMIYYAIQVYDLDMMKEYIMYCSELLEEYQYSKSTPYTIQRLKALYYSKTEQFDKAEQILESLIPKLEKLQMDPSCQVGLIACYNYRGEICMKQGDWETVNTYISKALASSHASQPTAGLGMSYTNMGIILYRLDNYDKASEYFDKARGCFQNLSIQWGRAKEEAYSALLKPKLGKAKRWRATKRHASMRIKTTVPIRSCSRPCTPSCRICPDSNLRNLRGSLSRQIMIQKKRKSSRNNPAGFPLFSIIILP